MWSGDKELFSLNRFKTWLNNQSQNHFSLLMTCHLRPWQSCEIIWPDMTVMRHDKRHFNCMYVQANLKSGSRERARLATERDYSVLHMDGINQSTNESNKYWVISDLRYLNVILNWIKNQNLQIMRLLQMLKQLIQFKFEF